MREVFATKRRDRAAALKFLERVMKRYGQPWTMVTGGHLTCHEFFKENRAAALAEWRQLAA